MQTITPSELKLLLDKDEKPILIDVREPYEIEEFSFNGLIMPLGTIQSSLPELEKYKNEEIIIYCQTGSRSAAAANYLNRQGFTDVKNLYGGIEAWKELVGA